MRRPFSALIGIMLIAVLTSGDLLAQQNIASVKPDIAQQKQIDRAYGMFMHFGLNTFNETEWSDGKLPVSSFNPEHLNCDQWVKTAKEAGFRYVILVTKHHDGFCLWDSKYTDYDVASNPVKTDIVRAVANSCKKYGIQLGLYYSLWDRHEPSFNDKNPQAYVDFMKNQLTELLTNYGNIVELWFDGGWAKKNEDWHIPELYAYVKKLQPNCQITVNHTIGTPANISAIQQPLNMHEGDPIRFFPVDFRTKDPNLARWDDPKLYEHGQKLYYLPFEHTICLSDRGNWFQKKNIMPVRGIDELEELFYWCTANNNVLVVNVPPDQHGIIRENERLALLALADRLDIRNGQKKLPKIKTNLLFNKPVTTSTPSDSAHVASMLNDYSLETWWQSSSEQVVINFDLQKNTSFNKLVLMEAPDNVKSNDGFSTIRNFRVADFDVEVFNDNNWMPIYSGSGIGACKTLRFPEKLYGSKLRVNIKKSKGSPKILNIALYGDE